MHQDQPRPARRPPLVLNVPAGPLQAVAVALLAEMQAERERALADVEALFLRLAQEATAAANAHAQQVAGGTLPAPVPAAAPSGCTALALVAGPLAPHVVTVLQDMRAKCDAAVEHLHQQFDAAATRLAEQLCAQAESAGQPLH